MDNFQVIIVRPGSTDLDEQGRIKGSLDVPLNDEGALQAIQTAVETEALEIDVIYSSPCKFAQQTAEQISRDGRVKVKVKSELNNLDHGLWHGRSIEELRQTQPKIYRQWQDNPESMCPPGGETIDDAKTRLEKLLRKLKRRHKNHSVAVVAPEPLASIFECIIESTQLGDLWQAECRSGGWKSLVVSASA